MFEDICRCICHTGHALHCMPCCWTCPNCGQHISFWGQERHSKRCQPVAGASEEDVLAARLLMGLGPMVPRLR